VDRVGLGKRLERRRDEDAQLVFEQPAWADDSLHQPLCHGRVARGQRVVEQDHLPE
jgi:hypothetical protein